MAPLIRRLLPMFVVLGCALTGSVLGAVALPAMIARFETSEAPPEVKPSPKPVPRGLPLDELDLMVNLADEHGRRVLKAKLVFEAKDSAAKAALETHLVEVKHLLISLLSEKQLGEVEGKQEKETLLRTIRLAVNERLALPDAVLNVYFAEFLIQ